MLLHMLALCGRNWRNVEFILCDGGPILDLLILNTEMKLQFSDGQLSQMLKLVSALISLVSAFKSEYKVSV